MNRTKYLVMSLAFAVSVIAPQRTLAANPAPVVLGSATNFAILAGSAITSTGGGTVNGDVGLSPAAGTKITGLSTNQVYGVIYTVDGTGPAGAVMDPTLLSAAKSNLTTAYNDAAGRPVDATVGTELGGTTVTQGVYNSAAGTFGITGILTLDAAGDPDAVFIFKMLSTLTTAASSAVTLINGAQAQNVFWQVGSSATLGTSSSFKGIILADQSITISAGSTLEGKALASVAVTYNGQHIFEPASTLVTVSDFRAMSRDGDVFVAWETAAEIGTIGFYLERREGGVWGRMNDELLLADFFAPFPRAYELPDPGAAPGGTYTWRLIEMDNFGRELLYGPWTLSVDGAGYGYEEWAAGIDWDGASSSSDDDPDGDGLTNRQEFLAGTDPLNANSLLRIESLRDVPPGSVAIVWQSASNKLYAVQISSDLKNGFAPFATGIPASPPLNTHTVEVDRAAASALYFRVIVE